MSNSPPPTYAVGGGATVESLRFVQTASDDGRPVDVESVAGSLDAELPHVRALATTVALSSTALTTVHAVQKRSIAAGAEALLGIAELLSAPVATTHGSDAYNNDECGALVNVHGVVIDRQTRSSDNLRWAGHWAGGVGETVLLELGQVGSAFDTVKVYIDCYRGAAAVCAGLLPGAVVVLRRVERLVSRGSGQLYCRFLPCSELSLGWGGVMESTVAAVRSSQFCSLYTHVAHLLAQWVLSCCARFAHF